MAHFKVTYQKENSVNIEWVPRQELLAWVKLNQDVLILGVPELVKGLPTESALKVFDLEIQAINELFGVVVTDIFKNCSYCLIPSSILVNPLTEFISRKEWLEKHCVKFSEGYSKRLDGYRIDRSKIYIGLT